MMEKEIITETDNTVIIDMVLPSPEDSSDGDEETLEENDELQQHVAGVTFTVALESFQNGDQDEDDDDDDDDDGEDEDSGTDYFHACPAGTQLKRAEHAGGGEASLPDTFQTNNLLHYERFKAYQDYMLGDCKTSEVRAFTADYLEKVVEPCDWQALWSTNVFTVLVEVKDVDFKDLKAQVKLLLPLQCEARGCELDDEALGAILEATKHRVALQELQVVYDESGDFDQTALAIEHLRFFYQHIWRKWDEEEEDDDFDYFVRCVEPRLRLHYDILEDRVPAGLVSEYESLLSRCAQCFQQFSSLRNGFSSDSESELDNVSMVEGLHLCERMEVLRRKLCIMENPLLRYVLGYKGNSRQQCVQAKGPRPGGGREVHVVTGSTTAIQLQSLLTTRLSPLYSAQDTEIQFHSDVVQAVSRCHQDDVVIILPGHYCITSPIFIPDSITVEGFGLPDEVVIEKKNKKGDAFVETTGANVKISNIKFIQRDSIEGILCVRQGKLEMENCVMQCETTGVIVRSAAQLTMNMCDLYGSKGPGVEIYPGSVCNLLNNGIHHCKEGILIKDFSDELDVMPRITMENNAIHNNEGYGVILVKHSDAEKDQALQLRAADERAEEEEDVGSAAEQGRATYLAVRVVDEGAPLTPATSSSYGMGGRVPPEVTEGNGAIERELTASSSAKLLLRRQLSRSREPSSTRPDDALLEREMFVSIRGNQFRRNGLGSFGSFLY